MPRLVVWTRCSSPPTEPRLFGSSSLLISSGDPRPEDTEQSKNIGVGGWRWLAKSWSRWHISVASSWGLFLDLLKIEVLASEVSWLWECQGFIPKGREGVFRPPVGGWGMSQPRYKAEEWRTLLGTTLLLTLLLILQHGFWVSSTSGLQWLTVGAPDKKQGRKELARRGA